jgi:hypothetical protein
MVQKPGMTPAFLIALIASVVLSTCSTETGTGSDTLAGAWRGKVRFTSGPFAATADLEFMYAFNLGGTMTESSNYDASPPVPPAYGAWKKTGARKYEAKYQFFQSKTISTADEIVKGGGWAPDGFGILSQTITLSEDGNSFDSRITLELFNNQGRAGTGGGEGTANGRRISF